MASTRNQAGQTRRTHSALGFPPTPRLAADIEACLTTWKSGKGAERGAWPPCKSPPPPAAAAAAKVQGDAPPSSPVTFLCIALLQSCGERCLGTCSSMSRAGLRRCCLCGGRSCGTACRSGASRTRSRCTCRRRSASLEQRRSRTVPGSMQEMPHVQVFQLAHRRRHQQGRQQHGHQWQQQRPAFRTRRTACRPGLGWARSCCSPQTATRGGCWRRRWVLPWVLLGLPEQTAGCTLALRLLGGELVPMLPTATSCC